MASCWLLPHHTQREVRGRPFKVSIDVLCLEHGDGGEDTDEPAEHLSLPLLLSVVLLAVRCVGVQEVQRRHRTFKFNKPGLCGNCGYLPVLDTNMINTTSVGTAMFLVRSLSSAAAKALAGCCGPLARKGVSKLRSMHPCACGV